MPPAARILAEWAARLRPEDIPVTVRENAVLRVLDTLGCALAGAREDHVPALLALLERSGEGPCTVVGSALTSGPAPAALVNGAMAHGLDFDDTHADSVCHASAVLVPTVLALVESEHLTGRAALTALVAGYEAMIRIGMAAPGRFHTRGWHATAACGPFGAAVTAGKCLGLGEAVDVGKRLDDLGHEWETVRSSFKLYPCCHLSHAYLDAITRLKRTGDLRAEEVEEIECLVPAGEAPIICEPVEAKLRPRTPYDAKFSLPFGIAAALARERVDIGVFSQESIGDANLLALTARVRHTIDPDSAFPRTFPGWVRVRLKDGRTLEAREESQRGGPDRPIAPDEVLAKFRDNAARALPPLRVAALEGGILGMESAVDLHSTIALCRGG